MSTRYWLVVLLVANGTVLLVVAIALACGAVLGRLGALLSPLVSIPLACYAAHRIGRWVDREQT